MAQNLQSAGATASGDNLQGPGLDPELELAVLADVIAVDLDREATPGARGVLGRGLDPGLAEPLEMIDLTVITRR